MKPRPIAALQNISEENDVNYARSNLLYNAQQVLLDMNASETQQSSSSSSSTSTSINRSAVTERTVIPTIVRDRTVNNPHHPKLDDSVEEPIRYISDAISTQLQYSDALTGQARAEFFTSIKVMTLGEVSKTTEGAYKWNQRDTGKTKTPITESHSSMATDIRILFCNASYEVFEDGMDSNFGIDLTSIIQDHGIAAVEEIEKLIHADGANIEVATEALICTGRANDNDTHHVRLSVLERALESDNVCIRDAASIAIEFMDDPAAIDSIKKAIAKEECKPLRQNLRDVLVQLQDAT